MNRIFTLTAAIAVLVAPAVAGAAGKNVPTPFPTPHLPNRPLHARLIVEVNRKGQVVRVAHGNLSGDRNFDVITIGNAMQMWIRKPDGTAITGTYSVTYDYNPHTHNVSRMPALVKPGGDWADKPGAATLIIRDAQREQQAVEARLQAEQMANERAKSKNLPDINAAIRRSMSAPTASPRP